MTRKIGPFVAAILASALVLTGCSAQSVFDTVTKPDPANSPGAESNTPSEPAEPKTEPEAVPVTQQETCDWGSPRVASGSANAPSGQSGDLATTLIGSWQHTHYDLGSGYEALNAGTDIRFVFPSTDRLLYCQDVDGATSQAENAVNMSLDGTEIVLPSPATGYTVTAWDANTMVWINNRDGSLYLLQRR